MAGLTDISLGNFTEVGVNAESEYDENSLVLIRCVQSVGDISDEATITDVSCYGQKYLRKLVGSANASAIEVVVNYDPTDPAQTTLFAAYTNNTIHAISIIMNESSSSDGDIPATDGTHICFDALVASASVTNSFDETRTVTFSLVPTKGIVDVNGSNGYQPNNTYPST